MNTGQTAFVLLAVISLGHPVSAQPTPESKSSAGSEPKPAASASEEPEPGPDADTLSAEDDAMLLEATSSDLAADGEVIEIESVSVRENATEVTVSAKQAARTPGIANDAIAAVSTTAGAARVSPSAGQLSLWGATESESRYYIDDIPVPRLFHLGGLRSIVPTNMVRTIMVVPGAARARFGRGIGGVVAVETVRREADALAIDAVLSPIEAAGAVRGPLGPRTSIALAARRGLLADTVEPLVSSDATMLLPIPTSWDYQGHLDHRVSPTDRIRLQFFGSGDSSTRGIPSVADGDRFSEERAEQFHRLAFRLARTGADASFSDLVLWIGADKDLLNADFETTTASIAERRVGAGLLVAAEKWTDETVRIRYGLDAEFERSVVELNGALGLPSREGDISAFGQPPGDRVNQDRVVASDVAVAGYASVRFSRGPFLLEPGLRIEPAVRIGDRIVPVRPTEPAVGTSELDVVFLPRLRAEFEIRTGKTLYVAFGRYNQQPSAHDRSPVFANPLLSAATSNHAVLGARLVLAEGLKLLLSGYAIDSRGLAARSEDATPSTAALLTSDGRGRVYGGQGSLDGVFRGVSFGLAAAFSRARRRSSAESNWRLFDYDQPVRMQAQVGWNGPLGLEFGARAELTSGYPRTAVESSVWNAGRQDFDPIFAAHNEDRLPMFFSLAARAAFRSTWKRMRWHLWLDVQNVTNRTNAEEFFYTTDYSQRAAIAGLPLLPMIGLEVGL